MGKTWEIGNHTFPIVWVLFSNPIPIAWYILSYGRCRAFPSISHSTRKCNKTHHVEKTWEIGNQTFPIVWVPISQLIPILWYTWSYGKWMGSHINFPWYRKMQQNPSYGEDLGNWYSYFSHSMGAFFPLDSHPMVLFITWEMYGFSNQFPIAWENSAKTIKWAKPGEYFFH